MFGILPFLIQWVALGMLGTKTLFPPSFYGPNPTIEADFSGYSGSSMPPKSHWTLLSEFQNLPEEDIETFLPQICNMILDRDSLNDPAIFDYFERIILSKCAQCLPFGLRVCGVLRVSCSSVDLSKVLRFSMRLIEILCHVVRALPQHHLKVYLKIC